MIVWGEDTIFSDADPPSNKKEGDDGEGSWWPAETVALSRRVFEVVSC